MVVPSHSAVAPDATGQVRLELAKLLDRGFVATDHCSPHFTSVKRGVDQTPKSNQYGLNLNALKGMRLFVKQLEQSKAEIRAILQQ